ncbi:carbohydrate ABC transporter permease [Actinopolymorpha singaporensis]|uniref:Carbohydrate ABC transporter membrane protein 1, CUT1 family n=1 Tax=Actinopolymorpha singaporensis TaxID=117157 RepID=A0A1H1LSP6_9ACTN|nr:sugar ABC transporter permease [Actinopolymorpha singaporensis]SDR77566.1 carbohydrate ABC transporter membrane protein 1, CUT1 family [Actinopolymorpha singaporensis]
MNTLARREARTGCLLLAPSLFGVGVFLILPVFVVLALSLTQWNLISPARWVGLANFRDILTDPKVGNSVLVTAFFVLIVIPVQTVLGLVAALLLNRRLPGSSVFRVVYVIPWICAPLALGVVWRWIFDPSDGALNALTGQRVEWLSSPVLALPAVASVTVWSQVGYVTLFFLAGLNAIPDQLYEAARIDGAGSRQVFWRITLPLLRPTTFFVLVTGVISSFQVFDTVYAMTKGGPAGHTDVIASRIYYEAFEAFRLGRAAALAVLLFVLLVAVTVGQQLYFRRRITYDLS